MKKLTEDQLQFVSLYRENSCLWDTSSEDYKNIQMCQSALEKIAEGMQINSFTVEDVKYKIKSIRSTYYLELDKIKKSSTSVASGNVYQPKVKWFAEFNAFIKNAMVKRKTQENTDNTRARLRDQFEDPSHGCPNVLAPPTEPPKKRSKVSQLYKIVNNMKEMQYELSKSETEEDEFDVFGKHVAKQLRKLSTEQAILGQDEIQRVITKCRLHDFKYRNTTYTYAPVSSLASTIESQINDDSAPGPSNDLNYRKTTYTYTLNAPVSSPASTIESKISDDTAPGPSYYILVQHSPASTIDTQDTDDSLNVMSNDPEYINIIMNAFINT